MITYKATNTRNGKFYIGSTDDFERRKKQHLSCNKNYPFQNALQKNPEYFEWELWEDSCDYPILEEALLEMFFGSEQCYNLCKSVIAPMKGRKHTDESKQKIRNAKKGKKAKLSEEGRQKLSRKMSGENSPNYGKPGNFLGRTHSKEAYEKMRQPRKNKPNKSNAHKEKIRKSRIGRTWWVNAEGQTVCQIENPGEDWQKGRVWRG